MRVWSQEGKGPGPSTAEKLIPWEQGEEAFSALRDPKLASLDCRF